MKEKVTIRLYEHAQQCARCEDHEYRPADEVKGWGYDRGDQIGLFERNGGYLMGVIDHVQPEVHQDEAGRYKLAVLWTQD